MDLDDLREKVSADTAVVYFENPSYLGGIECRGNEIAELAHGHGALLVVSVNPISLGLLETPRRYGADIICGDAQPLGVHLQYGGGNCGFVCCPDEERYAVEFPFLMACAMPTGTAGQIGFQMLNFENTSYCLRETAGDITSTNSELWSVPGGAYLAQMGPQGMREVGEYIIANTHYAKAKLDALDGVTVPLASTPFVEVVVNFDATGLTVAEINKALLGHGIFGGHDISREYPVLGQSALYCFTDVITKSDIDRLAEALQEIIA